MALLRLYKPGVTSLGNGELADRAGMARSTVTRITHQLVEYGFLQKEAGTGAFKLGPVVLSLAETYKTGSPVLRLCNPLMLEVASKYSIDVNLCQRDEDDMVYVESIRCRKEKLERRVRAGHRIPIELTSAGKAWLASLPEPEFQDRLLALPVEDALGQRLRNELVDARRDFKLYGYSTSQWMTSVAAMATPVQIPQQETLYLGFAIALADATGDRLRSVYGPALLTLAKRMRDVCVPDDS